PVVHLLPTWRPAQRALHSFPPRRSSDLGRHRPWSAAAAAARCNGRTAGSTSRPGPARPGNHSAAALDAPVRPPPRYEYRPADSRSEEHTSELQSRENLVCRLLLEKKKGL